MRINLILCTRIVIGSNEPITCDVETLIDDLLFWLTFNLVILNKIQYTIVRLRGGGSNEKSASYM